MNKITCSILAVAFAIVSCNSNKETQSKEVDEYYKSLSGNPQSLIIQRGSEPKTFSLANGTSIEIPEQAFVDQSGNLVTGEVEIKYEEFHNAADIIASGIPMNYDTADIKGNFQTAGMFKINGFHNGQPVAVAEGKSININMASYVDDGGYNFYELKDNNKKWTFLGVGKNKENLSKKNKLDAIAPVPEKPIKVQAYGPDLFVFDLDVNLSVYPELKEFKGVMWQLATAEENSKQMELPEKGKWSNIELQLQDREESVFLMNLYDGDNKAQVKVKPVLAGKNLEKAKARYEKMLSEYDKALAKRKMEEERLKGEATLFRSFAINNFGIFNYDRLYHMSGAVTVEADFKIEGKEYEDLNDFVVFLVTGEDRVVVKYPKFSWTTFTFLPKDNNKIVAVLAENKIAVLKSSKFKQLDLNKLKENKKHQFVLEVVNDKAISTYDLASIISRI